MAAEPSAAAIAASKPGANGDEGSHRSEHPGHGVRGSEQRAGTVLAIQAQIQRVEASAKGATFALGQRCFLLGLFPLLGEGVDGGTGLLMLGVESLLPRVQPGDPGLEGREVVLRLSGPGKRLLVGDPQSTDLVVSRGSTRTSER